MLSARSEAQTRKFTGQVFAYDLLAHAFKVASFAENRELVIFRLRHRQAFVKLLFESFGQTQLDPKYLDGSTTIAVRVTRDPSCDEDSPKFFAEGESLIPPGTIPDDEKTPSSHETKIEQKYRVTDAFSDQSIPKIAHLDCYRVEMPRK